METKSIRVLKVIIPVWLLMLVFTPALSVTITDDVLFPGKTLRINPDYKINRYSNGKIVVTSVNPAIQVRHEFTDFYADVLFATYRKQKIESMAENLRKKYYLSKDECRREIKHAINVLTDWNIIIQEGQTAEKR